MAIATMLTSARPASRELVRGEPVGVLANLTGFKNVSNLLGSNSPFSPTSWATSNFSNLGGINNLSNLGNLKMANLGDRKLANLRDKKSANLGDTNGGTNLLGTNLGSDPLFLPTSWATSNFSNLGGINNLSNLGNLKMANLGDRKLANLGDKKSANLGDTKSANGGGTKSINSQGNWSKSLFPGSNRLPQRNKMGSKPLGYPYFDSNIAGMLLIILQI